MTGTTDASPAGPDRADGSAWAVRAAGRTDAAGIGRCQVACWREAYTRLAPDGFFDGYGDGGDRAPGWEEILASPGVRAAVVVAGDGEVVGFSAGGPTEDDATAGGPAPRGLRLGSVYVRSDLYGSGAADLLLGLVVGDRPAYLWVFEDNPRARAFYARHGFRPDGTCTTDDWTGLPEVRLVR